MKFFSIAKTPAALLLFVVATLFSSQSIAQTLWDQAPDPTNSDLLIDQDIPGDSAVFSTYMVSDVTFSSAVFVDSVTTYYTNGNDTWTSSVTTGILNIFDGDALISSDDPTSGGDFGPGATNVSVVEIQPGILAVTASGLNINLAAGDYFFGLSASEPEIQEFHLPATPSFGQESFLRNPSGAFGLGSGWLPSTAFGVSPFEGSITISGVPEPSSCVVFAVGSVCLLVRRKRLR